MCDMGYAMKHWDVGRSIFLSHIADPTSHIIMYILTKVFSQKAV
jgi:hypothetical protein